MNAEAGAGADGVAAAAATPGALLRAQRERRGLSVQQAAEDLHLDSWMVEAIEDNRFDALGAPVYARGHLRKYATLLGLSPGQVIERYEALSGTPGEPTPVPAAISSPVRRERRRRSRLPLWIAAAALAAGIAWGAFELLRSRDANIVTTPELAAPERSVVSPDPLPSSGAGDVVPAPPPAGVEPSQEPQAQDVPGSALPATPAGEVRVQLEFSQPSWTEIYDATGKRLMFDTGMPGRTRTVVGQAPLQVTFGLASAVSMAVGDRPIVVPRRAGRDAAKFLIEADGSVSTQVATKTAGREASE